MASEEFIRANFSEEMNDKFYDNYDELIDDRTIIILYIEAVRTILNMIIDNESICDESIEDNLVD